MVLFAREGEGERWRNPVVKIKKKIGSWEPPEWSLIRSHKGVGVGVHLDSRTVDMEVGIRAEKRSYAKYRSLSFLKKRILRNGREGE